MPDYTLRDPDGNEYVVGNTSDRARLLSQGYEDITDAAQAAPAPPADEPAAEPKPKTADRPKASSAAGTQVRNDSK